MTEEYIYLGLSNIFQYFSYELTNNNVLRDIELSDPLRVLLAEFAYMTLGMSSGSQALEHSLGPHELRPIWSHLFLEFFL